MLRRVSFLFYWWFLKVLNLFLKGIINILIGMNLKVYEGMVVVYEVGFCNRVFLEEEVRINKF